jgi:capsule biosynthesis phosphatase
MVEEGKVIVMDLDGVICKPKAPNQSYADLEPDQEIIEQMREYKRKGFHIIINSSRNMRTYEGNLGKINAVTLKIALTYLDKHEIPYDEIFMGKPWCGREGFYVDDKAIRPDEFLKLSLEEIAELTSG